MGLAGSNQAMYRANTMCKLPHSIIFSKHLHRLLCFEAYDNVEVASNVFQCNSSDHTPQSIIHCFPTSTFSSNGANGQ